MHAWNAPEVPRLDPGPQQPRLHLFDTAQQRPVPAGPEVTDGRPAGMYVCGITPYDATHIGHANTYVAFDLLNRVWRDAGLAVHYVQNVTDVDDPLLERALRDGIDWRQLAADQIELFRTDMTALNVIPPADYVGAVESIDEVVAIIAELQARGAVYPVDDPDYPDLYFARSTDAEFGSLSHLDDAEARAVFAERGGDPDRAGKQDPLDCLVWRLQRPDEPGWDTPLGRGRPGWHIECTAIALNRLGSDFDVQAGGSDLVFPHHEMCASEARVATDRPFAQVYVHSGMVGLDGEKMSKSKGNLVLVSQLRQAGVDPMAIRLALLSQHFRDDWMWTDEILASAVERLATWREAVRLDAGMNAADVVTAIRTALADDLDAPAALAAVDAWAGASVAIDGDDTDAPSLVARTVDALLGVRL
ncbi:cysteine--1-D-myo-inosityl 2-amino-2-deoxy-alpha-D-glucopyranoside ligase [Microlunatus aurantiacus]|uniref:L-cysteine:1D-myo-inositol 2-amino-2-deoxy-alpha-D-glucopyranoside ligase n=1 Tax=Microlunatus aurantiacus TaxID=446786 RepID=A0ABP7E3S7_9ACTN